MLNFDTLLKSYNKNSFLTTTKTNRIDIKRLFNSNVDNNRCGIRIEFNVNSDDNNNNEQKKTIHFQLYFSHIFNTFGTLCAINTYMWTAYKLLTSGPIYLLSFSLSRFDIHTHKMEKHADNEEENQNKPMIQSVTLEWFLKLGLFIPQNTLLLTIVKYRFDSFTTSIENEPFKKKKWWTHMNAKYACMYDEKKIYLPLQIYSFHFTPCVQLESSQKALNQDTLLHA